MAIQVGLGISKKNEPVLAAKEAARLAITSINNQKCDLAIAFSSVGLASPALLKTLGSALGGIPIIGASGAAVIANDEILKQGLAVMVLGLPQTMRFNTASVERIKTKGTQAAGEELGQKLLSGLKNIARDLSIVFCDGMIHDISGLIYGLQERLGMSFPLVGGSASDNLAFKRAYLYFNQEVLDDAACGIIFGGKLSFGLGIKHGWKVLGKPHYVTKSYGNTVYEIDNAPALKLYEEYFASDAQGLREKLKFISILYPIGIYLSGEEEYLLRNLLSIEEDGSLNFQGNVPQDSSIRLMIGTKESCLEATRLAAEQAKKIPIKNFALVFDSVSRYILLKREAKIEPRIIRQALGSDCPVIGLYTYGEHAPLRAITYHGQTYSHNQTIEVLTFGA